MLCTGSTGYPNEDKIFLITDSRGFGLADHLSNHLTSSFTIPPHSGAAMLESVKKSLNHIYNEKWTQVYLLSGLCNITKSKIVSFRYDNPQLAMSSLRVEILQCIKMIQVNSTFRPPKCIVAPITGMDLDCYNNHASFTGNTTKQPLLNETVVGVNNLITELNTI